MVQRRDKNDISQEEKIKKLEERVRELESILELQHREEPDDELNKLYSRRKELLSGLIVEKDDAKNKELWESLPAIERCKYARWVFEQQKKDVEDMDAKIQELKPGKRAVSDINRAIRRVEQGQRRKRFEREKSKNMERCRPGMKKEGLGEENIGRKMSLL